MAFARRSALRAALNRRIKLSGDHVTTVDSVSLRVQEVNVLKAVKSKVETEYAAGTILQLLAEGTVSAHDKAISIKYPNSLYSYGVVSGTNILDQADGETQLSCIIILTQDVAQDKFAGLSFKLYVEGE